MQTKTEGFPFDIQITLDDMTSSGWEEAFEGCGLKEQISISDSLAKKGQKALEEGRRAQSKVLWLLADVCSRILQPGSVHEPFKPYSKIRNQRSAIPDDFSDQNIKYEKRGYVW